MCKEGPLSTVDILSLVNAAVSGGKRHALKDSLCVHISSCCGHLCSVLFVSKSSHVEFACLVSCKLFFVEGLCSFCPYDEHLKTHLAEINLRTRRLWITHSQTLTRTLLAPL